jgi:hypothetical protein
LYILSVFHVGDFYKIFFSQRKDKHQLASKQGKCSKTSSPRVR